MKRVFIIGNALIFVIAFFLICYVANAGEIRIGIGTNYSIMKGETSWINTGLDNQQDDSKKSFALSYIGDTKISWLRYGVGVGYRETAESHGEFVLDPCNERKQFSGGSLYTWQGVTMPECDFRFFAKSVTGETHAVQFTIIPTYHFSKDVSASLGVGISYFDSRIRIRWDYSKGVFSQCGCDGDSNQRRHDRSFYLEPSVTVGKFFASLYYAPKESAPESLSNGNYGFLAGVRF